MLVDVQTISIVIAASGLFIAAVNQILSSRRADKQRELTLQTQQLTLETRQAQLFMQIHNRWNSRDFTKSYGAVRYKYSNEEYAVLDKLTANPPSPEIDLDEYADYQMLRTFFEGLGILVKKELVDISLVEDLFSGRIIWFWEHIMEPYAEKYRKMLNDPTLYDEMEYLYNLMRKRQQQATTSS